MIYRMIVFGLRKSFEMHRKIIESPEGVPEGPGGLLGLAGHWKGSTPAYKGLARPTSRPPALWEGRRRGRPPPAFPPSEKKEREGRLPPFLPPCA